MRRWWAIRSRAVGARLARSRSTSTSSPPRPRAPAWCSTATRTTRPPPTSGAKATREFLARVNRESPDTTILVDEAYFEYVTDPDHDTHIPIAVENPRVVVARTFSKAFGMAGLRIGYAVGHKDTIKKMADWDAGTGTSSLNVLALHGALAAIQQDPSVTQPSARGTRRSATSRRSGSPIAA